MKTRSQTLSEAEDIVPDSEPSTRTNTSEGGLSSHSYVGFGQTSSDFIHEQPESSIFTRRGQPESSIYEDRGQPRSSPIPGVRSRNSSLDMQASQGTLVHGKTGTEISGSKRKLSEDSTNVINSYKIRCQQLEDENARLHKILIDVGAHKREEEKYLSRGVLRDSGLGYSIDARRNFGSIKEQVMSTILRIHSEANMLCNRIPKRSVSSDLDSKSRNLVLSMLLKEQSVTKPKSRDDLPEIKYYEYSDWVKAKGGIVELNKPEEQVKNRDMSFLEELDGTNCDNKTIEAIQSTAKSFFNTLKFAGLLPDSHEGLNHLFADRFNHYLASKHPQVAFCDNLWKASLVGKEIHAIIKQHS